MWGKSTGVVNLAMAATSPDNSGGGTGASDETIVLDASNEDVEGACF